MRLETVAIGAEKDLRKYLFSGEQAAEIEANSYRVPCLDRGHEYNEVAKI